MLLKKHPLAFAKRVLYKTTIGQLKYRRKNGYDAGRYWHDRFSRYGFSLKGAGHEGLSEEENQKMYTEAAQVFIELCQRENIDFPSMDVLEIGCGTGFYTQLLSNLGVKSYMGLDITDVLFPELRARFPQFRFVKRDVTSDKIDGRFDVVIMIDVIQHIVKEDKLSFAMNNIKNCLAPNGIFILAPITNISRRSLFYIRTWSLRYFEEKFTGYIFGELLPFRGSYILTIKKP